MCCIITRGRQELSDMCVLFDKEEEGEKSLCCPISRAGQNYFKHAPMDRIILPGICPCFREDCVHNRPNKGTCLYVFWGGLLFVPYDLEIKDNGSPM